MTNFNTLAVYGHSNNNAITSIVMKRTDLNILMGINLKRLRNLNKLTQEQLAERLGISQGLIPRWESGKTGIGKDVLLKLCSIFETNPYEFYIENNTPLPYTDLEKKALYMAREAEQSHLDYIAEEIIEYGKQRIERVKKQEKAVHDKGRTIRTKVAGRRN